MIRVKELVFAFAALLGLCGRPIFAEEPEEKVQVSFFFNGANAAANLATAYAQLQSLDPKFLFGGGTRLPSKDCLSVHAFFDLAVCEHLWPQAAWQVAAFEDLFWPRPAHGAKNAPIDLSDLKLPEAEVTTSLAFAAIDDSSVASLSGLTKARRKALCHAHSWDRLGADLKRSAALPTSPAGSQDCIVEVDPPKSLFGRPITPSRIVIVQPAYELTLQNKIDARETSDLVNTVIKAVLAADPTAVGTVLPSVSLDRARSAPNKIDLDKFCTKENLMATRHVLHWPDGEAREAQGAYLVVADPGVTQSMPFNAPAYYSDFLQSAPGSKLSFPCLGFSHDWPSEIERTVHAMAVATVAFGGDANIIMPDQTEFPFTGLLSPGDGEFEPTSSVGRREAKNRLRSPHVIVGSYDSGFTYLPDAAESYYSAVKETIQVGSGLPIFAASQRQTPEQRNFLTYFGGLPNADMYPQTDFCSELPTCLGGTPTAMVVAALSEDGKKLLDPESYRLGSSVVWVAAPGKDVVAAVPNQQNHVAFGVASGSSLAAPAVAAIALMLESAGHGSLEPQEAMARIAATSDLYSSRDKDPSGLLRMIDLVRFGPVNALRALKGAATDDDAIWAQGGQDLQMPVYRKIEAPKGLPSGKDNSGRVWICPDGEDGDSHVRGYLRVFDPNHVYNGPHYPHAQPTCIGVNQLLRVIEDGGSKNGKPTYTVIFREVRGGSYDGLFDVRIIRDSLLQPPESDAPEQCAVNGNQRPGVPACLYQLDPSSHRFVPLNLVGADIAFSPRHVNAGRLRANDAWTDVRQKVWSKGS